MLEPGALFADRYEVRAVLGQSAFSTVYQARDARADQWVALKILNRDFQRKNQESSIRFRRDAELLGELRHAHVARLLDLGESEGSVFVAQEYFEGELLRDWVKQRQGRPGDIPCILEILCQIAEGLDSAHAKGLLHRDIRSSNILLVDRTGEPEEEPPCGTHVWVRILDFGLARLVDYSRFLVRQTMAETFSYMSPEQAGLLKHPVDERADLYSLGVLGYELLGGDLPFRAEDPAAVLYHHLTKTPVPLRQRNAGVPEALSQIVDRLLAKIPDDRYVSAAALRGDLRAVQDAIRRGAPTAPLSVPKPAALEMPRLHVPLVERSGEMEVLHQAFTDLKIGRGRLLLVEGEAGIGKTRLVEEFRQKLLQQDCLFLYGKCDEYSHRIPYQPYRMALENLMASYRDWPKSMKEACRERVQRSVRDLGGLFTPLAAGVSGLFDCTPPLHELEPAQARERLQESLCRFLGALGTAAAPLVLVLDDLQWAEEESVQLLGRQTEQLAHQPCLLLGLYRRDEARANAPLWRLRTERKADREAGRVVPLAGLSPEGVRAFVREALPVSGPGYPMLCREIERISLGNPFVIRETLQALVEKRILQGNPAEGSWSFDPNRLGGSVLSSNVVHLILRRLERASAGTRRVLAAASALRGSFSFETLMPLVEMEEYELLDHLDAGVRLQFIEEIPPGRDRILYQFLHDRIREALYAQIPPDEKKRIHRRIGDTLEAAADPRETEEERVYDLAHHFLCGEDLPKALTYLTQAGEAARSQNAHREAVHYFAEALRIAGRSDPRGPGLQEALGDLYTILGEYDRALAFYDGIRATQETALARAAWHRKVGTVFQKKGNVGQAIRHLEEALLQLGRKPHRGKLFDLASILMHSLLPALPIPRNLDPLSQNPKERDQAARTVELTRIYRELTYLYLVGNMIKAIAAHLYSFRFALQTGDLSLQADAFRRHGVYLAHIRRFRKGATYLAKSLDLYRQLGDAWGIANTHNYMACHHFLQGNLEEALRKMESAIPGLEKAGDRFELETAYSHLASACWCLGENRKALRCFDALRNVVTQGGDERGELVVELGLGRSHGFLGEPEEAETHFRKGLEISTRAGHPFFWSMYFWMYGDFCVMSGNRRTGIPLLEKAIELTFRHQLFSFYMVQPFLSLTFAFLQNASEATPGKERSRWLRSAGRTLLKARLMGAGFPIYAGRRRILQGTYRSLRARKTCAGRSFRKGAAILESCAAHFYLAAAHQAYAEHLARFGDPEASLYRERAMEIRRFKGLPLETADHDRSTSSRTAEEGPDRRNEPALAVSAAGSGKPARRIEEEPMLSPESRAFQTLLEASRLITATLDLKEVLSRILELSMQSLGAERGLLLLDSRTLPSMPDIRPLPLSPQSLQMVILARHLEKETLASKAFAPSLRIILEVERRHTALLVAEAGDEANSQDDDGESSPEAYSILCVPLLDEGRLAGILYLDNHRVRQHFTRQDLESLESLASFAVIAARNARAFGEIRSQRDEIESLKERLQEEIVCLKEGIRSDSHFEEIVGTSPAMQPVFRFIEKAAPLDQPVLLLGETGTGKELVARAIHRLSRRCESPFIKINCAALPAGLLESELFGHEKGAFTGAIRRKIGRFELADSGTLFLDEIGEMAPELQAKLLRVLQDMEFERVGGTQSLRVDVRILAATNRDLQVEIRKGAFREDLYYRLNVLTLRIPPLRERREDIPLLASYFIDRLNKRLDKEVRGMSRQSMAMIQQYPWPGNVREMENLIERSMVLSSGTQLNLTDHLSLEKNPDAVESAGQQAVLPFIKHDYYDSVEAFKRWIIQDALERAGGSKKEAARLLGMAPSYLSRLLKGLGL